MWWRLWGDLGGWWCCATLIDDLELWLMEVWLGWCLGWWRFWYVDDLETVLFYILLVSWSLPHLRAGFLKPLLVGSKRTLVGSSNKSWNSYFSWYWEIWEDWSFLQHIVSNGFYQYIIEFSIHIWCLSSLWLIYSYYALMINKSDICYIRTGYKKLLGKVRKFGKSVITLIHPPFECDCCVQQEEAI